ncbi:MAG: hypothetical protein DCC56_12650 [Anaerolineae bacterium]|nr:MAG: hypothetical protein DCC56_12650 [Anaerolineae bacterium]
MMKMKTRFLSPLLLVAVILAACAPAPATQSSAVLPSATPLPPVESAGGEATQPPVATEPPTQAPLPVATSRGPNLEATDPSTVSLASGQYQFVEFFRFT